MMQSTAVITELMKQGKEGTHDLYLKIPYFLKTRLDAEICNQPWATVSDGCQQQDLTSLEHARSMYQHVLHAADKFIEVHSKNPHSDEGTLMMMDRFRVENEFQTDAARFVSEMAKCLEREKELIFTYQEPEHTDGNSAGHAEDITDQVEDRDLTVIEQLTKEACDQLNQAKNLTEEQTKCNERSLALFQSLAQGHNFSEMNPDDEAFDEMRRFTDEIQSMEMNQEAQMTQLINCKQEAIAALNEVNNQCSQYIRKLAEDVEAWKIAEARKSVKVGPDSRTDCLLNKFKRFGQVISTILNLFSDTGSLQVIRTEEQRNGSDNLDFTLTVGQLQMEFQGILRQVLQIIVTGQPKGVISIENKGRKDAPNYCTKKTQPFTSTVRILAAECFQGFQIMSSEVELVAEKDLAQRSTAVTSRDVRSCLKVDSSNGSQVPEVKFNIEVKNFCRVEQNNVYKQFFRLLYKVKVSVDGNEYSLQTMSLPFTFNTGANQILEHMGARMWYCASVQDLYNSGFQCPDPLSADDVISILDNRVAYLGKKTRRLTESDKVFLKGRLPVASDGTVTMQGFLKDKMRALRSDEPLSYSFYTWFYAVIHSIELLLLNAWEDGIIYGFCSEKTAEEILMDPKVPEGTFILRPSVSEIKKTSSLEATAALAMEVKLRNEYAQPFDGHSSEFKVESLPLFYKHIEKNTLYRAIKGLEFKKKPLAKVLYGRDRRMDLSVLKGYVKEREQRFFPEYRVLMEKIEKFNIRFGSQAGTAAAEEVSDRDDDSGREPSKRKRRYRKSSSNTQGQSISQSPLLPAVIDDSPSGSSMLPIFSELSAGEIKQEKSPPMQVQSSSAVNEQSPRSGTQGKKIPGMPDEKTISGNGQKTNGMMSSEWSHQTTFGNVVVDVSQISKAVSGSSSLHSQSGHTSPEYVPSGMENAVFSVASSDHSRVSPHLYSAQYQNSRTNNNYSSESASSPEYNVMYNNVLINTSQVSEINLPFQDLNPASVLSNRSESSQGSMRMSPSHLLPQTTANLPTVLSEARESKKQPRRRGSNKGNGFSTNGKKSTISSRSEVRSLMLMPDMDQGTSPLSHFIQNGFQQESFPSHIEQTSYSADSNVLTLLMGGSSSPYGDMELEIMDESQLTACIIEQRMGLQLSPDSGVGDQSPSPVSSLGINPLSRLFHSGSVINGQDSQMS